MADGTPKKEPTAAEAMFFFSILKNLKNKADVDWEGVASEQGFKSAEVARVRFGQVKRKLGIFADGSSTPKSAGTTPTKVTKTTKGAKSTTTTPRSGKKSNGKGKGKGKEFGIGGGIGMASGSLGVKMEDDEEEDQDGSPSQGRMRMFKMEPGGEDEEEDDSKKFMEGLMSDENPFTL